MTAAKICKRVTGEPARNVDARTKRVCKQELKVGGGGITRDEVFRSEKGRKIMRGWRN